MRTFDYIVLGSGCSGAMAAQTLVDAGVNTTMIDAGITNTSHDAKVPDGDFLELRSTDKHQDKYFIGKNASGVAWGSIGKGEQITPPRQHILARVDETIPVDSTTFSPFESLGYGGLGIGWGLQCWEYSPEDSKKAGLQPTAMSKAYQVVADRIGMSATKDDAARYTIGTLKGYDASPRMDRNHQVLYERYQAKREALNAKGFYMGRTPLALITNDRGDRKAYAYHDMDFYSDNDRSAWRPWMTVDALRKHKNFQYIGGQMAVRFQETDGYVLVTCRALDNSSEATYRCRRLILATSALGSARLILRSLGEPKAQLPLLCNPYTYVPCLQPRFVGQESEPGKLGFTQLSLFLDETQSGKNMSVASVYSYQSLMLFRLLRHLPLNFVDGRIIMRYLMSGIVIMGIHHPDNPSRQKYVSLIPNPKTPTGDMLHASYRLNEQEMSEHRTREKMFVSAMRALRAYSLGLVNPGYGASIHYAGTLPFSKKDAPYTLAPSGRLHGSRNVYVADSSGFRYLPAPGLTFSLMANAHLAAEGALQHA